MATITIYDETTAGKRTPALSIDFLKAQITVRELIRKRVYEEVRDYNLSTPGHFTGLIQPTQAEQVLNGYKLRKKRKIDRQKQFERAVQAFDSNGFFILVDDLQVESLDQQIEITPDTQISFVKLVQLIGG